MDFNLLELGEHLEKALDANALTDLVPQDLEIEAHNTLWQESDPDELTVLRLLPSVPATSVVHEFTRVTSFDTGGGRSDGWFGERSLPPEAVFGTDRQTVNIRLMGEVGPTYLLAGLERTQRALGTSGAENIQRQARRMSVLRKKNRALLRSDTSTIRQGANGIRPKGIAQLIREGTDGTVGTESPFGSHAIDMEGQPLNIDTIRARMGKGTVLFGGFTDLIMDPFTRLDFESQLDPAQRLPIPAMGSPFMLGQMVGGLQTQFGKVHFHTDNILSPEYYAGRYTTTLETGAPSSLPTVAAPSAGAHSTSKFNAGDAGSFFWVVTEVVDGIEGLGTRAPSGSSVTAVAAGDRVTLSITPGNALADSFRVYRGNSGDAVTDAWFLFEVSNSGSGGAVTAYDTNSYRPNTSHAFGFRLMGPGQQALHGPGGLDAARAASSSFLQAKDNPKNTIAVAHLGPQMGIMALGAILATLSRPLVYSAFAPEVRNPYQNVYFYNIKPTSSL